jgi:ring-1,2-phenylacetyl-CoA epoxidase subunit PaaC
MQDETMRQTALKELLFRLADDEVIIGHRNAEWTGHGPILEEDIAFSSMAQDEIGHAQVYYALLHALGEADPDRLAFVRGPADFHCAQLVELPKGDWAFSVARQFLYDAAESVRLAALSKSSHAPLAQAARKFAGEEKYHLMHGKTWVIQLGRAGQDSRARLQTALDRALPYALGFFETTGADAAIVAEGLCAPEAELKAQWFALVAPILNEAGLALPDAAPIEGGRRGQHTEHLAALLNDMQLVFRTDPEATW